MKSVKKSVIIAAGGSGVRMGANIPKQFILLNGKPLLMRAMEPFFCYDEKLSIVAALPVEHINKWQQLCCEYNFTIAHTVVAGGNTRTDSVRNALAILPDDGLIAIHDGARPFVTPIFIANCFDVAAQHGCAIPVTPVIDSLRKQTEDGNSYTVTRDNLRAVQTPQIFWAKWLKNAYRKALHSSTAFTDDASVVETAGYKITLTDGSRENIKITEPSDWKLAEALCLFFG